jgi:hypothetical protein
MFVAGPIAQVMNAQLDNPFLLRASHDAFAQGRATNFREQSDDVDPHLQTNVECPKPGVQRSLPLFVGILGAARGGFAKKLFDNFQHRSLAVACGGTCQQGADGVNRLAATANHPPHVSPPKLELENNGAAIGNFRKHHVIWKLDQLPNNKLKKLPHGTKSNRDLIADKQQSSIGWRIAFCQMTGGCRFAPG